MNDILRSIKPPANPNVPKLRTGDIVAVHLKIKEGTRERVQIFKGTVLYQHSNGVGSTFAVRRVASNGIGVERIFLTHSPRIEKVVVERHSKVRRSRLYYMRERTGKNARLKQKFSK